MVNGGVIPKPSQIRDYYVWRLSGGKRWAQKVKHKNITLIVHELSAEEGRYILDIMAVLLDLDQLFPCGNTVAYLLDAHSLTATNNKTVSQANMRTVHDYDIDFNNVHVFNSDNVGYAKKAINDTLPCLFPLCVHYLRGLWVRQVFQDVVFHSKHQEELISNVLAERS